MSEARVVLRGAELGLLDLLLSGLLGPADGYRLPGEAGLDWPVAPVLLVPSPEARIVLTDADNTPLATLDVKGADADGAGLWWVAGILQPERPPEHGIARSNRLTRSTRLRGALVALVSGAFSAADALALDRGAGGGAVDVVVLGPAESAQAADLFADVQRWAAIRGDTSVWYLPEAVAHDGVDLPAVVLSQLGVEDFVDLRRSGARSADEVGAVLLFTGLSGAGKSTIARAVAERIAATGAHRPVLLDGDDVRHELSGELGFSRSDRDQNLRRIAWVAGRVASGGGLAICAPIAPFASSRAAMRAVVEPTAPFLVVYVATPLAVAESRDRKGLYAKARAGMIEDFTGIHSPYEPPTDADLELDTSVMDVGECVEQTISMLGAHRVIPA